MTDSLPTFDATLTARLRVTANDYDDVRDTIAAVIERVHGVVLDDGTVVEFLSENVEIAA